MDDTRAYLDRIGFKGEVKHDLATLKELKRAHWLNLPYENLDTVAGNKFDIEMWENILFVRVIQTSSAVKQ